jgi:hypothetical protein
VEEDRFEIELTPVEEHRSRRHRRSPAPTSEPAPLDPIDPPSPEDADDVIVTVGTELSGDDLPADRWLGTERARIATAATVAAIVALLLGWMLGRAGRGDTADDAARTASTVAYDERTERATESTSLAGDTIPPVRTTSPRRTTTTKVVQIETGTVAVDERLAGAAIELVGLSSGRIVEADLGTGATRTIPVDVRGGGPEVLHVGPEWVLTSSFEGPSRLLVLADGSVERAALGDPWSTLWVPGTDRFWRVVDWRPGPVTFVEIMVDGSATGSELDLPHGADSWLADPAGDILTTVAGGWYAVNADGAGLIGHGDLVAAGPTTAVLHACDEQLECGYVVIDRATGVARELAPVDDAGDPVNLESSSLLGPFSASPVSPNGRWAAVVVLDTSSACICLLDLEAGLVTELTRYDYGPTGVQTFFSADGRYVFYLRGTVPHVVDLRSGEQFPVFTERVFWNAFGLREASASTPPSADTTEG